MVIHDIHNPSVYGALSDGLGTFDKDKQGPLPSGVVTSDTRSDTSGSMRGKPIMTLICIAFIVSAT